MALCGNVRVGPRVPGFLRGRSREHFATQSQLLRGRFERRSLSPGLAPFAAKWRKGRACRLGYALGGVLGAPGSIGISGLSRSPRAVGGTGTDGLEDEARNRTNLSELGDVHADGTEWSVHPIVDGSEPTWEHVNMPVRVVHAAVMYGALAFAGNALCNVVGVDCWGGFHWDMGMVMTGLGYAVPPMILALAILEDEVVKAWPAARAVREVEDKDLISFFSGMSPWQFASIAAAGALSEELLFRVAIQGSLAHALKISGTGGVDETVHGIAALTGFIPMFVPFAQGLAAFLTSSLIGSMYYITTSPKDPKYVISYSNQGRRDLKKRVEVWYERHQSRKIYSPLMEALLALYLGLEWVQTGNILASMVTHSLYSTVMVGSGLRRIRDQGRKPKE